MLAGSKNSSSPEVEGDHWTNFRHISDTGKIKSCSITFNNPNGDGETSVLAVWETEGGGFQRGQGEQENFIQANEGTNQVPKESNTRRNTEKIQGDTKVCIGSCRKTSFSFTS